MAGVDRLCDRACMNNESDNKNHPFTLDITPAQRTAGHFEWAIRKHGKLVERSDRPQSSERSAREKGQAALERQFRGER